MSNTPITPYLCFGGRCEEALDFYRSALGAQVEFLMRFHESPEPPPPGMMAEGWEKKIMHCSFTVVGSRLMASDGCWRDTGKGFEGVSLHIALPTVEDVDRVFAAMSDGGTVEMPPEKTFWSSRFGTLKDRFGMSWMISVAEEYVPS